VERIIGQCVPVYWQIPLASKIRSGARSSFQSTRPREARLEIPAACADDAEHLIVEEKLWRKARRLN
jgi:hypothetical protein